MKRSKIKHLLTSGLAVMMSVAVLTGCQYRITDKTVEDEVAAALAEAEEQWKQETEKQVNEAVADALKTYEEEQNKVTAESFGIVDDPSAVVVPDTSVMTDEKLDQIEMPVTQADNSGNEETAVGDTLQIVFMGDSIFDSVRDDTGIAHQVGDALGADIYNLAIGGSCAGIQTHKSWKLDEWSEVDFLGVVYAMENKIDRQIFSPYKSGEIMNTLNPEKTDYFIIQYGTNDFLAYIPIACDLGYCYSLSGALEYGINELKENYPNAKIIVCTPYYMQFWTADRSTFLGDSHVVNNGFGTHLDYISWAEGIAEDCGVEALNMYDLLGVDGYSVDKLTEDGIHPNQELRTKYAQILIDKINEMEEED